MARSVQLRPDIQVIAEIAAVDQLVTRAMERALPAGLSRAQFNLLIHLNLFGEATPGDLADRFLLTKGAITNLLTRLESDRLVTVRIDAADRRRKRLGLTEAGARVLADSEVRLRAVAEAVRRALPPEAFANTLPILSGLRERLAEQLLQH